MIRLDKKIVIIMLTLFFLISVVCLMSNNESKGVEYAVFSYILFFDHSKIIKYDYIFVSCLVLGFVLNFIDIFYKNMYLINIYSVIICSLAILVYWKKIGVKNE
ncbi:hypothetical protein [Clostridium folliculivorans]|uniref:Uncharacterized protein n=1 Tax=Clostridium folliculivorans TaxID=2886038 RepID=A0A9W5Y0D9_9CLOT|nr:hypothetical protein [Clostridium folliculivorans]GKU24295.1 hypothetical protein CFOLD11_11210 [Clostridium folliculivorans]GKU30400.1 hypothetical protein CFB3_25070 [Clostridium folliculivorans]